MVLTLENFDGAPALDVIQLYQAQQGTGWLSGCDASLVQTDAAIRISIASGQIVVENSTTGVSGGNIDLDPGDAKHPRKDIVYADTNGALGVVDGTPRRPVGEVANPTDRETYVPEPSDLSSLDGGIAWDQVVPLAEVWVPADATGESDMQNALVDYVRDRRARPWPDYLVSDSGSVASHSTTHESGGGDAIDPDALAGFDEAAQDAVGGILGALLAYDDGANTIGADTVTSDTATLSSGSAVISTGLGAGNEVTVTLDPSGGGNNTADVKASARSFWDDSASEIKVEILEDGTSVGNPDIGYTIYQK